MLYVLRGEPSTGSNFVHQVHTFLSRFELSTGIRSMLMVDPGWPPQVSAATANYLYRIVEEALNNVRLHSGAARVDVQLGTAGVRVSLVARGDGRGVVGSDGSRRHARGVTAMRERAVLLGGEFRLADPNAERSRYTRCSFCGKGQDQVEYLVAGPGVYICDVCTELCNEVVSHRSASGPREGTAMKVIRQARLLLNAPMEGGTGRMRSFLATEFLDALNRLVATLPPDARVDQPPNGGMGEAALVFSWEEDLPSETEITH